MHAIKQDTRCNTLLVFYCDVLKNERVYVTIII